MNNLKSTKWNQFLRRNLPQGVCIGVFTTLIIKLIEKGWGENTMESLFQTFFLELWPMWCGIGMCLVYLVLCEVISIHKYIAKGLKFDAKLDELGIERRELMTHVHNSYNGLSNEVDRSLNALSERIDKMENGASEDV